MYSQLRGLRSKYFVKWQCTGQTGDQINPILRADTNSFESLNFVNTRHSSILQLFYPAAKSNPERLALQISKE